MRGLYQSEGLPRFRCVDQPDITFSKDKTRVIINVNVHEGTQYRFGKLNFDGDLVFRPVSKLEGGTESRFSDPCPNSRRN